VLKIFSRDNVSFKSSIIKISILTFIIWLLFYIISQIDFLIRFVHSYIHEMIVYSWIVAIIVAAFSNYNIQTGGTSRYVTIILGSTTIRMILSVIILIILLLRRPDDKLILIMNFFIVYLSYLLFEIYSIITNLRTFSKNDIKYGK
jgi:hypothetical protein